MRRFYIFLAVALMAISSVWAALTPEQITKSLQKNFAGVKDYKVDAVLTVKSKSLNVTAMPLTIYYKHPGKVHIDAKEGFAMLPKDIRIGNPAEDLAKNFHIQVLGTQKTGGRSVATVKLIPRQTQMVNPPAAKAWIDTDRGLLLSMSSDGNPGAKVKSTWTYTRIDGKYWLPSQIKAEMNMTQTPDRGTPDPDQPGHRFRSSQPMEGTMTIKFKNYKVNQGIPASIFKEPKR